MRAQEVTSAQKVLCSPAALLTGAGGFARTVLRASWRRQATTASTETE
ncbi:hypothetical protein AB0J35_00490 [Nonomuraea angiospora]